MSPPDWADVPPGPPAASSTSTSAPTSVAPSAALAPAAPMPTTTTSASRSQAATSAAASGSVTRPSDMGGDVTRRCHHAPMLDPRTPVLVGVGSITQRGDGDVDAADLDEPISLMRRAAEAAAADSTAPD